MHPRIDYSTKVSAIVSSYNRYDSLIQALDGIRKQTYRNIEIIVVNDCSTDPRYYSGRATDVVWLDTEKNTRKIFGYPCLGYVRNKGIEVATGEYIAFLDDDDLWLPDKISRQLTSMVAGGYTMSCTEGLMGDGLFNPEGQYPVYHREHYRSFCQTFFTRHYGGWTGILPDVFDIELIRKHNFIIHSSVIVKREILDKVGLYKEFPLGGVEIDGEFFYEDWELWKRCLAHTDCLHLNSPLVYYDGGLSKKRVSHYFRFLSPGFWKKRS
uniref:Glycosyltransferase involved in cell wall bisynthesis n=1 Tax=Candidatus Kentrum sp. FW TaxID=2126338 RepID=A0A450TYW7_9GAMM|nr:MAG: Glycosyltransferase involved in cell wall bisynthesis [Candidatus Kentron sp. FW]